MPSYIAPDPLTTKPNTKPAPREITVVGAGIVGVATALYLQRDGHTVTLVDRDHPGEGCSRGNAGILAVDSVIPLAKTNNIKKIPRMLLDPLGPLCIRWRYLPHLTPWLLRFLACWRPRQFSASTRALAALALHALDAHHDLLKQAGALELIREKGYLFAYLTEKGFLGDQSERELQRHYGIQVEELSGAELRALVPALSPNLQRGVLFPNSGHTVNPFRLVQTLAEDFRRRGGTIKRANVTDVSIHDSKQVQIKTDTGPLSAEAIVIALGAWSGRLAARLGNAVPLDTERGYHVMLPTPEVELERPVLFDDYKFAATPMEDGLCLAGTVEFAGVDAPPNYERARILLERGRQMLPGIRADGHSVWMGCRPSLPDSLPVIGRSPSHANVFFAFGHQHLGLTLSAITGRLIADQVAGRDGDIDLTPYRIDRF